VPRGTWGEEIPQTYTSRPLQQYQLGPDLTRSPFWRGTAGSISPRDAFILLTFINHPSLIDSYGEALADLDLSSSEALSLRQKLLDLWGECRLGAEDLKAEIERCGLGPARQRLEAITAHHYSLWTISPEAADTDAEEPLKQALALHRKVRALNRELDLAKAALAEDGSEANLARLNDIGEQLRSLAGTEAVIEGFGAASGRQSGAV
jgi:DNA primase